MIDPEAALFATQPQPRESSVQIAGNVDRFAARFAYEKLITLLSPHVRECPISRLIVQLDDAKAAAYKCISVAFVRPEP